MLALDDSNLNTVLPDPERLQAVHAALHTQVDSGELPFLRLHEDLAVCERIAEFAKSAALKYDDVVMLGIGGSSLGGRALVEAVGGSGARVHFPDNLDPEPFSRLLSGLDLQRTLFNCISKSGGTLETLAQLLVVRQALIDALGADSLPEHLVLTTDPERGFLRRLATQEGLTAWEVPPGVGGRFSVFTPVGLVPAALAGADLAGIYRGMAWAAERLASSDPAENPALRLAGALYGQDVEHGRAILYTVPYANRLRPVAEWFGQLWAESLGKADGGPTPVSALGATDQHSQLQRWMEGADTAVLGFIEVEHFARDITIPAGGLDDPAVNWMTGHTLGGILGIEKRATEQALTQAGRPNFTFKLERVNEESVAALLLILQAATAYAGGLYGIDPFDQPGVEAGKIIAKGMLGAP